MTTAPSPPTQSRTSRIPCLLIVGAFGCLILCIGIGVMAAAGYFLLGPNSITPLVGVRPLATFTPLAIPTLAASTPTTSPTTAPVPASAPTVPVNPSPAHAWNTFRGVHAPFSVAYPSDWTVDRDNEADGMVVFVSPDQAAAASIIFLQAGPLFVEQALDRINNQILSRNGAVIVISSNKNPDGSITEELEYTSIALGGRVHSFARLLRVGDKYFLALFDAQLDEYARFTNIGRRFVDSLVVGQ